MKDAILRGCVAFGGVVLLLTGTASAQTGQNFGEIVGKVTDQQGAVLPGVVITLSGPAVMGAPAATTNEHGAFRFPAVPSGTYKVTFELSGFSTFVRDGIVVAVRTTVTLDVQMTLAKVQETVTVTGQSPVVDVQNTKVGARLDKETLTEIPTQRTIFGATTTLPGMVMGTQDVAGLYSGTSTGMVSHGATQYNLNFFGVSTDTPQDYGSMYYVDYGSAEEISVDTAAMGAEIGGPGGANINVIPKSGGNQMKGTLYVTATGREMHLVGTNIDDRLRSQGITGGTRIQKLVDINGDLGGPIKKDRVWYFLSVRQYNTAEQIINFPIDFNTKLRNYLLRNTFKLSRNNNLSVFWTFNRKAQPNRNAAANTPPESTWYQLSDKNLENLNWTSVLGQNSFAEVSSSMFRMYWPTWYAKEWYAENPKVNPSYDTVTQQYWGASSTGERFRDSRRLQVNGAVTHYKDDFLGGNHQMKTGFELWHGFGSDGLDVYNDTAYRYRNGAPYEIRVYNTPLSQRTHMKNISIFGQDRMTYSRFTISLGLRYAYYNGYLPEQTGGGGYWPQYFPRTTYPQLDPGFAWKTWAPRTGLVYKLTEDGKNVAKVSYNRYFNNMYTWHFSDVINPNVLRTSGMNVYTWYGDLNGNGVVDDNEYNHKPKSVFAPKNNRIDPSFRDPKDDELMVGYQRDVGANMGFGATYIGRWFTDNWADTQVGIPADGYYAQTYVDPGPDNLIGTSDDRTIIGWNVKDAYLGKEAYVRKNVPGTVTYRGLELTFDKRMADRWQLHASYVYSRINGPVWYDSGGRQAEDPNDPNAQTNVVGRGVYDQPHAFKVQGSYEMRYGISLGVNFQALSGYTTDRTISLPLSQGSTTLRTDPPGTYRTDFMNLLSVRANKRFKLAGTSRLNGFIEFHNLLNTNAAQSEYSTTQSFKSQAEFDAKRTSVNYFGRVNTLIAPRVVKIGFKFEF
jgi:hypothetical protein